MASGSHILGMGAIESKEAQSARKSKCRPWSLSERDRKKERKKLRLTQNSERWVGRPS